MDNRRKPFTRKKNPRGYKPTANTKRVMTAIHSFEGMLSHSQIVRLCFPGCTSKWPLARMLHYFDHHLVKKYDASHVNGRNLGEMIYTLDNHGALLAAETKQIDWVDFTWRKSPRWSTLNHDLAINDFRIDVVKACESKSAFSLGRWISEYELRLLRPRIPGRLDSFFILRRMSKMQPGRVEQLALHLEIDMGNHPNYRMMKRKVKPILKFFGTNSYAKHFGVREGACLFVTTSKKRIHDLKKAIEDCGGAGLFYLTTFEAVAAETVLTKPIWHLAGSDYVFSLETMPLSPVEAGVLHDTTSTRFAVQERLFV